LKRTILFAAVFVLCIADIFFGSNAVICSYAAVEEEEVCYEEIITYDIWKHSNGKWQYTGSPGSSVKFDYETVISFDTSKKLKDVKVEFLKVDSSHKWYNMAVKSASVSSVSYNSRSVRYTVSTSLNANAAPVDIKQYDWQNESVEGYRYYIPVRIRVVYEKAESGGADESETGEETGNETEFPDGGEDGEADNESDEENYADEYDVEADMLMPGEGYVGHRILIQDLSVFSNNTDTFTAYRFYKSGLGKNSFRKESGPGAVSFYNADRQSTAYYTDKYAVFSETGDYTVRVTAKINGGKSASCTGRIRILPVPKVSVQLSGIQKENRKQVLKISTALQPESKLKKLRIEIKDGQGKNAVHLEYPEVKSDNTGSISDKIKTRPIIQSDSSEYYSKLLLEFLTKNTEEEVFSYTVSVEDEAGRTDNVSGKFTVFPDKAPIASITVDKYSIRNKGGNSADIEAVDNSITFDDDVERKWSAEDGENPGREIVFRDNSLGTGKSVIAGCSGVGKVRLKLEIKDIIPEEQTLKEYLSEEDYKSAAAEAETEIINIAPFVTLSAKEEQKAEIMVIASDNKRADAEEFIKNAKIKLGEKGIDVETELHVTGNCSKDGSTVSKVSKIETPFNYYAQWTPFEDKNFTADSSRMYKIGADFGTPAGGVYKNEPMPAEPYSINAYSVSGGELLWSRAFGSNQIDLMKSFELSQDDREKNLYISNGDKTLVFDKTDGTTVGSISADIRGSIFIRNSIVYSFSDKGIIRADLGTGNVSVISGATVCGSAEIVSGIINFAVNNGTVLRRGYFNPANETVEYETVEGSSSEYDLAEFDIFGNMAVVQRRDGKARYVHLYDNQNKPVISVYSDSCGNDYYVSKDENGKFSHAVFIKNYTSTTNSGSTKYITKIKCESLWGYGEASAKLTSSSDYKTDDRILYMFSRDGKAYMVTGAEYWYVYNLGTGNNYSKAYSFVFDTEAGSVTASRGTDNGFFNMGSDVEYGMMSEDCVVTQFTVGDPAQNGIKGSKNSFAAINRDAETVITEKYRKYLSKSINPKAVFIFTDDSFFNGSEGSIENSALSILAGQEGVSIFDTGGGEKAAACLNSFVKAIGNASDNKEEKRFFKKGQTVKIAGIYSDYENDPSKKSCYLYYHYPYNDGENPDVNCITDENFNIVKNIRNEELSEPVTVFYQDGMYKVVHWQYDSTGNESYDKKSNIAEMVFYIRGTASVPLIKTISTVPAAPKEKESLSVKIFCDDEDKDTLSLNTKIYCDEVLIKESNDTGINADANGNYPAVTVKISDSAKAGKYRVISKVSDGTGTSAKESVFTIVSDYRISGAVNHTEKWEENRKKYNKTLFLNEYNTDSSFSRYCLLTKPRKRGKNVFWSEERFILRSAVSGEPVRVTAAIKGTSFAVDLKNSGKKDSEGNKVYSGELWNSAIKGKWGVLKPAQVTFVFTAYYSGGASKTDEATIIIDDTDSYWRVHKTY